MQACLRLAHSLPLVWSKVKWVNMYLYCMTGFMWLQKESSDGSFIRKVSGLNMDAKTVLFFVVIFSRTLDIEGRYKTKLNIFKPCHSTASADQMKNQDGPPFKSWAEYWNELLKTPKPFLTFGRMGLLDLKTFAIFTFKTRVMSRFSSWL